MKYRIKNTSLRSVINLTHYATFITSAVRSIFSGATVNVYSNYFEFFPTASVTNTELRKMGKAIVATCPYLNSIKTSYGYSTQLFIAF